MSHPHIDDEFTDRTIRELKRQLASAESARDAAVTKIAEYERLVPKLISDRVPIELIRDDETMAQALRRYARERDELRLQHSTALNAARLHVKRLAEAAVTCRDMAEDDAERTDFEMLRLDREGILSVINELMRDPRALDEPEPTEAEVNGGPTDIEF